MIRFACPGCNSTFSVDDSKGGKAGKCPKCAAQFVIPTAAEAGVSPPPPPPEPRRAPAPPPPPADPGTVEIKPCPKCQARLTVAVSDLGVDVECPYCQAVYTAKRAGGQEPSRPGRRPADEERPSRRRRDEDEEDRPSRRRRAVADDEDEDDDRPSRRRDEDEEDDDRPRRRKRRRPSRSSEVDTVARLNYVLGGLQLCCGCFISVIGGFAGAGLNAAAAQQRNGVPAGAGGAVTVVMAILGGFILLYGLFMIVAGVGVSNRRTWGRVMTFITGSLAVLSALGGLVNVVTSLVGGNIPGALGGLVGIGIWGGYAFTALRAMINHGDEFE